MKKFLGGFAFAGIIKLLIYVISTAIKLIANVMVFFGLYMPFFYLIYGEMLILFAGFKITPYNSDLGLFFFGLALCCACSVIITVKNLILKPIQAVFGRDKKEAEVRYREVVRYRPPMRYYGGEDYPRPRRLLPIPERSADYGYLRIDSPREYMDKLDRYYESPEVYRSEAHPDIIVYEYEDHFDLYRLSGDRLEFYNTRYR